MQSAWIDRDADAAIARYARPRPRRGAAGLYHAAAGPGSAAGAARRRQHLGEDAACRSQRRGRSTCSASRAPAGTWARSSPPGLPAVRLAPLLKLRAREKLSDEEMVRLQRANLIDPTAPNPSVEALLHAFIPHKFVDHTHSTAVLALTDQPDGEALCREVYGKRVGYVPYIMPGFGLAKAAAEVFDADPRRRPGSGQARHLQFRRRCARKPMSA